MIQKNAMRFFKLSITTNYKTDDYKFCKFENMRIFMRCAKSFWTIPFNY